MKSTRTNLLIIKIIISNTYVGHLAQLVRAFASHARDRRFESYNAHLSTNIDYYNNSFKTPFGVK